MKKLDLFMIDMDDVRIILQQYIRGLLKQIDAYANWIDIEWNIVDMRYCRLLQNLYLEWWDYMVEEWRIEY